MEVEEALGAPSPTLGVGDAAYRERGSLSLAQELAVTGEMLQIEAAVRFAVARIDEYSHG